MSAAAEPETRAGVTFTRYSFGIDGPAFADYSRNQLQLALQARGELPQGMMLNPSPYYAAMTGTGELWVGEDGLPLRQILRLQFPEQRQERVRSEITVTFRNFAEPVSGGFLAVTDPVVLVQNVTAFLPRLATVVLMMALPLALVLYRRKRKLYQAVVISLCLHDGGRTALEHATYSRIL